MPSTGHGLRSIYLNVVSATTNTFAGAAELRVQAATVLASGGTLVVDLVVDGSLPKVAVNGPVPVEAAVDGAGHVGGLMLWVDDGRLSGWSTGGSARKRLTVPPASAIGMPVAEQ